MSTHSPEVGTILRRARSSDAELVWQCRQALHDSEAIKSSAVNENFESHLAWFSRVVNDPTRLFFIIEKDKKWLGYLRFDPMDDPAGYRVSIALLTNVRGTGIGGTALMQGCVQAECLGLYPLFADISVMNQASRRIFMNCGFAPLCDKVSSDGFLRFIRNLSSKPSSPSAS